MSVLQISMFIVFIIIIICVVLFLTHLHKRIFTYNSLSELLIHILRSYLLFTVLTIPVTYYFFSKLSISLLLIILAILLGIHILSAGVYYFFFRKKDACNLSNKVTNSASAQQEASNSISSIGIDKNTKEKIFSLLLLKSKVDIGPMDYNLLSWINTDKDITYLEGAAGFGLLQPVDHIRDINDCFIKCFHSLPQNGLLAVKLIPLECKEEDLRNRTGKFFFKLVYPFYFIWYRALPKMRIIGKLYEHITIGKNRWISKTELMGRLYYCGFDVLESAVQGSYFLVIARKDHVPLISREPSYHGLITLERVGYKGEIIRIHKMRTMYPYSEFLQKKVYEENQLTTTGKFHNDYRITNLGRLFRKYWIDEFPQIIEWLRGYIKLVGIRAMSRHYFSLYPEEYKALYKQVKPGILSPLFDENNDGFNDIVRIEQKYLESYLKESVTTDIKYFFLIIFQIIRGTRSK